jgi:GT2 family glycosyltransferase
MKVHVVTPYRTDKNLGLAYNEAISQIPNDDWVCLIDYDVCFLTPDAIAILNGYAEQNQDAGLMTCYTGRIHPLAKHQLLYGQVTDNADINFHISRAEGQKKFLYKTTEIKKEISGFLMMVSKKTWNENKFTENGKCLGVDNDYCWRLLASNKSILRMDGLYVWHTYRLKNGITDKTHLK